MSKTRKAAIVFAVLIAIAACGPRYNPTTGMYTVYGVAKFMLPAGYTEVGSTSVNVLPNSYITGAFLYQAFSTTFFQDEEAYILSQVLTVPNSRFFIRPLGGTKVSKWGGGWRINHYQLDPSSTSFEYKEYFSYLRKKGLPIASMYEVTMYDRLIGRRAIARVLFLKPSGPSGYGPMPPAKEFYTLERDDFR